METVFIANFGSIAEAELSKNFLLENGIKSMIQKHGIHYGGDGGDSQGANLLALEKDVERAIELLNSLK